MKVKLKEPTFSETVDAIEDYLKKETQEPGHRFDWTIFVDADEFQQYPYEYKLEALLNLFASGAINLEAEPPFVWVTLK